MPVARVNDGASQRWLTIAVATVECVVSSPHPRRRTTTAAAASWFLIYSHRQQLIHKQISLRTYMWNLSSPLIRALDKRAGISFTAKDESSSGLQLIFKLRHGYVYFYVLEVRNSEWNNSIRRFEQTEMVQSWENRIGTLVPSEHTVVKSEDENNVYNWVSK